MIESVSIILLITLLFYLKTITYKYVSDDIASLKTQPGFKNKWHKRFLQLRGSLKTHPPEDHLITTGIHGLVCAFIYLAFGANNVSFVAALLFCFNPINNQGSVWISGRGYVLSTLFILMAISIPVLGPIFLLACTYYNIGYISPLILIGSEARYLLLFMPVIWWFMFKKFKKDVHAKVKLEMFVEDKKIHWRKIVLAIKTFGFYFVHALIPIKTTFYHSFLQSAAGSGKEKALTMKDRFFWIGLISIITIAFYWIYVPWNMVSFGLFWWCVGIAPFLNLMRMSQEIAERYCYLPNVGLMVALSVLISSNPIIQTAFIVMYATKMWFYMDGYTDDYWIVEYACLNSPQSWFAWHVKAMKRWEVQSIKEALILWVMAKNISPKEFKLLFNIASVLKVGNNAKEADEFIKLAAANVPAGQEEDVKKLIEEWNQGKLAVLL